MKGHANAAFTLLSQLLKPRESGHDSRSILAGYCRVIGVARHDIWR